MKITKMGVVPTEFYKMVCNNCGCEAEYTLDEVHHDRDGSYVICPCCGAFISHFKYDLI